MKDLISAEDYNEVTDSLRKALAAKKELEAENKHLKERLETAELERERVDDLEQVLTKMCEYHEKQATWDKGDNGYYKAKRLLNSAQ